MARLKMSPLSLLLSAVFFFSTNVFALSAVLGIDLGTEYIKASLVKPGIPLEIVLTKDSRRKEISAVTFKPSPNGAKTGEYPERVYGSDAMALAPRFPGDVFPNLKPLVGLPADSAEVNEYVLRHPGLQTEKHKLRGTASFKSAKAFTPEEEAWMIEELLAMQLQSIRTNAEALAGPGTTVRSVVLTVPPFYTTEEKRATEMAAELAGLKVLALISDGLAVGLNYATSRQFPNINEGAKPEYHMIFDMGAGSTKATVLKFQSRTVKDIGKFNKTVQEVQVLGSGWDRTLGGDALNYLIVDDMVKQFVESPKAQKASVEADKVKAHGRAIAKLTKEAERLRHILSANQDTQGSFEGLYDDVDFKYKITRAHFEEMASSHAERVNAAIHKTLAAANIDIKDLNSVILHGGTSRTPFVQKQLEKVLGSAEKIRTNVNSDEAAVFGAGFRAAELSPSFRVKEIRVSDGAVYPVGFRWKTDEGKPKHQRLWTAVSHLGAPAKEVTFTNSEDFSIEFYQLVESPVTGNEVEAPTKLFTTKNLTASVAELVEKYKCEKADMRLKVSARLASDNGEVEIAKATIECEAEEPEKEGIMDGVKNLFGFGNKKDASKDGSDSSTEEGAASSSASTETTSTSTSTASSASDSASADSKPAEKKKQLIVIPVKFTLEKVGMAQLPKEDYTKVKDRLKAFDASDRGRRQREEALNQLEAFTYKVRDLIENQAFLAHATAEERATLEKKNSDASDWLYGDGADATKEELKARLKGLQDIVNPVQKRIDEAAKRPELIQGLKEALKSTKEFSASMRKQIADHEEFLAARSAAAETMASSSTDGSGTLTVTGTPAATGDFDGLEDDEPASATLKLANMDELDKERGPVPPLYTTQDLKESEDLHDSISKWLEEKLQAQEKLGATDDPVLLSKDLKEKRDRLDKAGVDLAMKGVRNFEKRQKKDSKTKTKTKKVKAGSKTKTAGKPDATLKFGDGNTLSDEEIERLIKSARQQAGQSEETPKAGEMKKEEPIKHEEL